MKRSKFKELLITEVLLPHLISDDKEFMDYVAEDVLRLCEEVGMLPPIIGNKAAFDTVEDEILLRWEPEDE